jgi:hypothetical protein
MMMVAPPTGSTYRAPLSLDGLFTAFRHREGARGDHLFSVPGHYVRGNRSSLRRSIVLRKPRDVPGGPGTLTAITPARGNRNPASGEATQGETVTTVIQRKPPGWSRPGRHFQSQKEIRDANHRDPNRES